MSDSNFSALDINSEMSSIILDGSDEDQDQED
jgi:hypothetical protein